MDIIFYQSTPSSLSALDVFDARIFCFVSQPQSLSRFENGNSAALSQEQVLRVFH
jgi:hypothetical protein